jgi:thiamine pyrophosphate-dependent acetolactate synthase large subunit-like protein
MGGTMSADTAMPTTGIDRREFVARLLRACPDALVVSGLGSPSYDCFAAGDSDRYYYLWGAMGGATPMALGLALAQPDRSVMVVTGDGESLMGLGALATVGAQQPANLTIVVLDNGRFGETGMQRSHTSLGTRLAEVARGCGIARSTEVHSLDGVDALARQVIERSGPAFAQVFIRDEAMPRALPPRDGGYVKNRFRRQLGLDPI